MNRFVQVPTAGSPAEVPGGSLVPTLPGSWYTDPGVFAREQRAIFDTHWLCVARSGDIPAPGQFLVVQAGSESVLVVRQQDGTLRAFLNVCRHRGARLCLDESGQASRYLRCPYHAWSYELGGRLAAAPNLAKMPDIDRDDRGLVRVALREWLGYTWVCLADEPPSFDDTVTGAVTARLGDPRAVDAYTPADLAVGRRISYDVAANWKLIVENFMECYHCAPIHPELTSVLPEFAGGYAAQYYVGHGASFAGRVDGFTVDGSPGFGRLPGVTDEQDRRYYAVTIRPQVFINLVPDHVILHRMTPLGPDRTLVVCDWLFDAGVVAAGQDLSRSVELFDRVNQQDFAACERTQPSMSSRAYRDGGVLVPSEHHIGAFHSWVRDQVADRPA
ncbi:MAG TPA: aromatic ring-hydroxylating dioxygenase subunit alpha [Trebonia sp.]|jgi:Rieske 2Fe-2S family protein|nr:aromatic ring-hydroxylating dioxygenase subunit alpha [Trebonia sp.]